MTVFVWNPSSGTATVFSKSTIIKGLSPGRDTAHTTTHPTCRRQAYQHIEGNTTHTYTYLFLSTPAHSRIPPAPLAIPLQPMWDVGSAGECAIENTPEKVMTESFCSDDTYDSAATTAPGEHSCHAGACLQIRTSTESSASGASHCCRSKEVDLKRIAYPNLEFVATKWHHKRRWLKQTRVLRILQNGIENALNKPTVHTAHPVPVRYSSDSDDTPAVPPSPSPSPSRHIRTFSCYSSPDDPTSPLGCTPEKKTFFDHYGDEHHGSTPSTHVYASPNSEQPTKLNGFTTKRISYNKVEGLVLVERNYFILKVRDDHDYHYITPDAVRIVWEIQERMKMNEGRRRYYGYAASRVGRAEPCKILHAFRAQKLPSPLDLQENLRSLQRESLLELHFMDVLMDTTCLEGAAMKRVVRELHEIVHSQEVLHHLAVRASPTSTPRARTLQTLPYLAEVREVLSSKKVEFLHDFLQHRSEGVVEYARGAGGGSTPRSTSFGTESERDSLSRCPSSWDENESFGCEILENTMQAASVEAVPPIRVHSPRRMPRGRKRSGLCVFTSQALSSAAAESTDEEAAKALDCAIQRMAYRDRTVTDAMYLLLIRDTELKKKRMQLKRNLRRLKGRPPQYFDVSDALADCGWDDAVTELDTLGAKTLPCQKLDCLVMMMRQLFTIAATDSTEKRTYALDDILPLVIYCVSKCSLVDPWAEAEYMTSLTDPSSTDERAYFLVVFISALEFIISMPLSRSDSEDSNNGTEVQRELSFEKVPLVV